MHFAGRIRWSTYDENTSGTPALEQTRTQNAANEITDFTNTTGAAWTDPTHDAAGNVTLAPSPLAPSTSADDQTYVWDAWNRLVEVKEGETTIAEFVYDGLNRRIIKTIDSTDYHYYLSEENQVLEEQIDTGSPAVRNEFVWHPYYVDALATRLDKTGGGNGVYYHSLHDANFNITAMVNGSATAQERYHYTPYGQITFLDSSFANPAAISATNQENLFTGRQLDPEMGLFYHRARYYHAIMGRFVGRDPAGYSAGDPNLYRYVFNNPLLYTDPTGTGIWDYWTQSTYLDKNGTWQWGFTTQQEKRDICKKIHDAYKAAGDKAGGGKTETDCDKLKEIVQNLLDEIAGRQKYLDLGCDYRVWSDPPPTKSPKEMEKGHLEELDNLRRYQDKVDDRLTDPKGPCGCKK